MIANEDHLDDIYDTTGLFRGEVMELKEGRGSNVNPPGSTRRAAYYPDGEFPSIPSVFVHMPDWTVNNTARSILFLSCPLRKISSSGIRYTRYIFCFPSGKFSIPAAVLVNILSGGFCLVNYYQKSFVLHYSEPEKVFRTMRLSRNDISYLRTAEMIVPASAPACPPFPFSGREP